MFFLCFFKLIFWGFLLCFAFFSSCFFVIFRFFGVFSSGFPAEGERGGEFVRFFLVFGPGPVLLCFFFVFSSCFFGFLVFFGFFFQVVFCVLFLLFRVFPAKCPEVSQGFFGEVAGDVT